MERRNKALNINAYANFLQILHIVNFLVSKGLFQKMSLLGTNVQASGLSHAELSSWESLFQVLFSNSFYCILSLGLWPLSSVITCCIFRDQDLPLHCVFLMSALIWDLPSPILPSHHLQQTLVIIWVSFLKVFIFTQWHPEVKINSTSVMSDGILSLFTYISICSTSVQIPTIFHV